MKLEDIKVGMKVMFTPDVDLPEIGIVKSKGQSDAVFVVYSCKGDWGNYWKYPGIATHVSNLKPGWPFDKITPAIIDAVAKFLGEDKIRWFAHVKGLKGKINTILLLNPKKKGMSYYYVSMREGAIVRHFMSTLEDCKDWNEKDFSREWINVVECLI